MNRIGQSSKQPINQNIPHTQTAHTSVVSEKVDNIAKTELALQESNEASSLLKPTAHSFSSLDSDAGRLTTTELPREIRPSALVHRSINAIAEKFKPYDKDTDLAPASYWNTNAPISEERRHGVSTGIERDYTAHGVTTTTNSRHRGAETDSQTRVRGPEQPPHPDEGRGEWNRPFSLTLAQWWKGKSEGSGYAISHKVSAEHQAGTAEAKATLYGAERRVSAFVGGLVGHGGIEGSISAEVAATAIGASVTAEIKSKKVKIAGADINVRAVVSAHSYVGVNAGAYASSSVNIHKPEASISVGGSVFAGARSKNHIDFGLGGVFNLRVTNEYWAGIGAEADASAGFGRGKVSLSAGIGAGLGVGTKVGIEVEVDVVAAAKMVKHAADRDGDGKITLNDPATGVAQGMNLAAAGIEKSVDGVIGLFDANGDGKFSPLDLQMRLMQGGSSIKKGAESTAKFVREQAINAGQAMHRAADRDGDGTLSLRDVSAGIQQLGDNIVESGKSISQAAKRVGEVATALGRGTIRDLQEAGHAIQQGTQAAAQGLHRAVDRDGDGQLTLRDIAAGGQQIAQAAVKGGQVIAENIDHTKRAIRQAAQTTVDGLQRGAQATVDGLQRGAQATVDGLQRGAQATVDGLQRGAQAIHRVADRDGDGRLTVRDAMVGMVQTRDAVASGVTNAAQAIAESTQQVARSAHRAADRDGDGRLTLRDAAVGIEQTANAIGQGIGAAATAVADTSVAIGQGISSGAKSAARGVTSAGRAVASGAKQVASSAADQVKTAASTVADGARSAYTRASASIQRLGEFFGFGD
jgi:hypothetical protein